LTVEIFVVGFFVDVKEAEGQVVVLGLDGNPGVLVNRADAAMTEAESIELWLVAVGGWRWSLSVEIVVHLLLL